MRLRIATFNIRCPVLHDLGDYWERRKHITAATIKALAPDIIGLQECYRSQAEYLASQLDGYEWVGVGRDEGRDRGEMVPLFHRTDRVERLDVCHFWLSETPDDPGSRSWCTAFPRMVTWGRFRLGERELCVFNTHFDHFSPRARKRSASLIRRRVAEHRPVPAVVMGDFNTVAGRAPHEVLTAEGDDIRFTDAGLASDTDPTTTGTFHGFKGKTDGPRIDWILTTPEWMVDSYAVDHTNEDGRYPSDHFPVVADLTLR